MRVVIPELMLLTWGHLLSTISPPIYHEMDYKSSTNYFYNIHFLVSLITQLEWSHRIPETEDCLGEEEN